MSLPRLSFLLSLRTMAFGISFLVTALVISFLGSSHAFAEAGAWWPAYGLLANYLCFVVIRRELRKEGRTIASLINYQPEKIRKDLLLAVPFVLLSLILAVGGAFLFGFLMYHRYPYELLPRFSDMPPAVVIALVVIFPVVNSFLEEVSYNGLLFQRLETQFGSMAAAIVLLLLFFTLQHVFITFAPDMKYLAWRLLSFVPLLLFWIIVYARMRRLTTLIIVHWFMDTFAMVSIIMAPN
jgi:membrane protease YdiL (CAAX protease family)